MQIKTKIRTFFPIKIQNRLLPQQPNSSVSSPLISNNALPEQSSKKMELKSTNNIINDTKDKLSLGADINRPSTNKILLRKSESIQSIDFKSEISNEFKQKTGYTPKDSQKPKNNHYQLPEYYFVTKRQPIIDGKQADQIELQKRYSLGSDYNQYSYQRKSEGMRKLQQFEKRVLTWQQNNGKKEKEVTKDRLSLSTQMNKLQSQKAKIEQREDKSQCSGHNVQITTNVSNSQGETQTIKDINSGQKEKEKTNLVEQLNIERQKRKQIEQIILNYESKLREKQKKASEAEQMKQKYKNLLDKNSDNLSILMTELQKTKSLNDVLNKNLMVQKKKSEEDKACIDKNKEQLALLKKQYQYEKLSHKNEINILITKYQSEIKKLQQQVELKTSKYNIDIEARDQSATIMKSENIKLRQQMRICTIQIEEHEARAKQLQQNIQSTIQAIDLLQSKLQISKRQNSLSQIKLTQSLKLYEECREEKNRQLVDFTLQKKNMENINQQLKCNIQQLKSINEQLISENLRLREFILQQSQEKQREKERDEQISKDRQYIKDLENTLKVQEQKEKIISQKQKQAQQKVVQLSNILITTQQNHKNELKMLREELDIKSKQIFQKLTDYYQEKERLNQQISNYKAKIQQKQKQLNEQGYKMTEIENLIRGQEEKRNVQQINGEDIQKLKIILNDMKEKIASVEEVYKVFSKKISIEMVESLKTLGFEEQTSSLIQEQSSIEVNLNTETPQNRLRNLFNKSYGQTESLKNAYQNILLQNKKLKSKQSLHIPERDKQKQIKFFAEVACSTDQSLIANLNYNRQISEQPNNKQALFSEKECFIDKSVKEEILNHEQVEKREQKSELDRQEPQYEYLHDQLQQKQHIIEVMQGCIEDYKKMIKEMKHKLEFQEQIEYNYLEVLDFFQISIEDNEPNQAHEQLLDVINSFTTKLQKMVQTINLLQSQFNKVTAENNELLEKKRKMIQQLKKCQDMIQKACVENEALQLRNKEVEERLTNDQIYIGQLVKIIDTSNQQVVKSHMAIINFKWSQLIQLQKHMQGKGESSQKSYHDFGQNLQSLEEISIQVSTSKDKGNGPYTQRQIIEIDLSDMKNYQEGQSYFEQTRVDTTEKRQHELYNNDRQERTQEFLQDEINKVNKVENKEFQEKKSTIEVENGERGHDSQISEEQVVQVNCPEEQKLSQKNGQIKETLGGQESSIQNKLQIEQSRPILNCQHYQIPVNHLDLQKQEQLIQNFTPETLVEDKYQTVELTGQMPNMSIDLVSLFQKQDNQSKQIQNWQQIIISDVKVQNSTFHIQKKQMEENLTYINNIEDKKDQGQQEQSLSKQPDWLVDQNLSKTRIAPRQRSAEQQEQQQIEQRVLNDRQIRDDRQNEQLVQVEGDSKQQSLLYFKQSEVSQPFDLRNQNSQIQLNEQYSFEESQEQQDQIAKGQSSSQIQNQAQGQNNIGEFNQEQVDEKQDCSQNGKEYSGSISSSGQQIHEINQAKGLLQQNQETQLVEAEIQQILPIITQQKQQN